PSVLSLTDTATPPTHTLSLHDALPISPSPPVGDRAQLRRKSRTPCRAPASYRSRCHSRRRNRDGRRCRNAPRSAGSPIRCRWRRSEEHTSELQSRENLVCRLLLEKKKI